MQPPFPQTDITGAVVIVWRVRGETIRSVLCNIVVHSAMHTHMNRLTSSKVNVTFTASKDAACHDYVNNQND